jgi:uncharacterized membrane protein YeiH
MTGMMMKRSQFPAGRKLLYAFDLTGVAVFAVSGALAAGRAHLDLFGVLVLAAVTAIGGGTLRDVLLRRAVFWIDDPLYLYVIFAAALLTYAGAAWLSPFSSALLIADAFGLGLFAISGAEVAASERDSPVVVVVLGTMTGVAGGVVRDVLSGVVPLLLRRDIYATAAIVGISLYLVARAANVPRNWAYVTGIILTVAVRLCAVTWNWQLPVFTIQ